MKNLTKLFASVGIAVVVICAVASTGAHAAGFAPLRMTDPGETCYSWEGGHGSAGSFSKCQPSVEVVVLQPMAPPPAVVAAAPCVPAADHRDPRAQAPAPAVPQAEAQGHLQTSMNYDDSEDCYVVMDGAMRGLVNGLLIYAVIGLVAYVLYYIFGG